MRLTQFILFGLLLAVSSLNATESVRLKQLGKIDGWRENHLVGFGIVTGLAGTGDSARSKATRQTLANFMSNFDVLIAPEQVNSRNVAIVSVMALMPPVAHLGDRIDVIVTSMGDARSLVGGTLLLAPLKGPDGKVYALAQGPVSVGGYRYDQFGNVAQKNHPTAGAISGGAQVEEEVVAAALNADGSVNYVLADPDYTTAERVARALNAKLGAGYARLVDSSTVHIVPPARFANSRLDFVSLIEAIQIDPDTRARVVVNEKTGTIVSGGEVKLSKVTIAHGDLRVSIQNRFSVSQPQAIYRPSGGIRTQVIPNTQINVNEEKGDLVELPESSSVGDLLHALKRTKASTRDTITILQGIKTAGALHADLIIQ